MPIIEGTSDTTLRQETNPCSALAMDAVTLIRFAVKIIDPKIISNLITMLLRRYEYVYSTSI